jgi:hypothetical protein
MVFTVQELRNDWHEVGSPIASADSEAVERVGTLTGMYRVRAVGSRIWHYFWLERGARPEAMDN